MDLGATTRAILALIISGLLAQLSFAAAPEASTPPPLPAIAISEQGLSPTGALAGRGHAFVLENNAESTVAVEFMLREGQRVACAPRGRTPRLDQTFSLSAGGSLICHARPGRYAFTARGPLRLAADAIGVGRFTGWIEIS